MDPETTVNIACVRWGDKYPEHYVKRLQQAVYLHAPLGQQYRFYCITDSKIQGVECIPPSRPDWPGFWSKLNLFDGDNVPSGPTLYFDLDTVLVNNWKPLIDHIGINLTISLPFGDSPRLRFNASVMSYRPEYHTEAIFLDFDEASDELMQRLTGDEEVYYPYVTRVWNKGQVVSYRHTVRDAMMISPKTVAVCFHGQPKPHEVRASWIDTNWRNVQQTLLENW